jgi:limonene 1,2-monooxygenase
MVMGIPLHFGVFITPFHPVGQSPTVALEYDMERVVALDRLGFDEAWFGEHHSGGYELIACPEVFIAAAHGGRPVGAAGPPHPRLAG